MDREIRDLRIATARAYAVAEHLVEELNDTVQALEEHVTRSRSAALPADTSSDTPKGASLGQVGRQRP